jgi:hypothetical protein
MSLRDDLEAMERHQRNGTFAEYLNGTAKPLPQDPPPTDPTANGGLDNYGFPQSRGE